MKCEYITLEERRRIEKIYGTGAGAVEIAKSLGRHPATIYREIERGDTGQLDKYQRHEYSAELAQRRAQENIRRRGKHRIEVEDEAAATIY